VARPRSDWQRHIRLEADRTFAGYGPDEGLTAAVARDVIAPQPRHYFVPPAFLKTTATAAEYEEFSGLRLFRF
jgi:hypothetical protein